MLSFPTCKAACCAKMSARIQWDADPGRRINIIPAPAIPVTCLRLCIWSRWCSGAGKFRQRHDRGVDEQQVLAQAEVDFVLKEMEGHATNVHYFGGVQFQQYGLHHVEIYLGDELRLRFPLPVVRVVAE